MWRVDETTEMLPIEMTNITGTYLHDLNEYCLLDIFSVDSLTPMDLCSLAEACKRFKQIIQCVFPMELRITSLKSDNRSHTILNKSKVHCDQDLERVLKNFGPRLVALKLDEANQSVGNMVAKYCGDATLKRLRFHNLSSIESFRVLMQPMFQRMLALTIDDCHFLGSSPDFTCDSLVELKISESTGCAAILEKNFPNLERFTFRCDNPSSANYDDNTVEISEFISRHERLRKLHLNGSSIYYNTDLIQAIGNNCKELEKLTLRCLRRLSTLFSPKIPDDAVELLTLPKLRTLDICINFANRDLIIALLQASSSLEKVALYFDQDFPIHVFNALSQLENLRELIVFRFPFDEIPCTMLTQLRKLCLFQLFADQFSGTELLAMITQLTNLEELQLHSMRRNGFVLTERDLIRIHEAVGQRANVLTLKCRCDFDVLENCDRYRKVRLIKLT